MHSQSAGKNVACIVTPEFPGATVSGGLATAVYWQAKTMAAAGIEVTVYCTAKVATGTTAQWCQKFRQELNINFIFADEWMMQHQPELYRIPTDPSYYNLIRADWIKEFLLQNDFPVVYLQDYLGEGLRVLQCKQLGLNFQKTFFVTTIHGSTEWAYENLELFTPSTDALVTHHMERECVKLADAVLAPSQYLKEWVCQRWGVAASRIHVLPYCFEDPTPGPVEQTYKDFEQLVFFGRLETRKGLQIFTEALKSSDLLKNKVKKVVFLGRSGQVGTVTGREWVEKFEKDNPGYVVEMLSSFDTFQAWQWMHSQKKTLFVAPSMADNLPLAVIELFLRRLPFITTNVGGIPEIVGKNPACLCDATMPQLRKQMEGVFESGSLTVRHDTGFNAPLARKQTVELHNKYMEQAAKLKQAAPAWQGMHLNPNKPFVSVIIAHYNSTKLLRYTLETFVAQQTHYPFEVMVLDDGSTKPGEQERFEALTQDFATDKRFSFYPQGVNSGAAAVRNVGLKKAKGKYVIFFDADDEVLPNMIETYCNAIEHSKLDVLSCYYEVVLQQTTENPGRLKLETDRYYKPIGPALEAGIFWNVFGGTPGIFRKSLLDKHGGFSAQSPHYKRLPTGDWDWDLYTKVAHSGAKMGVVPMPLLRYRVSAGSQSDFNSRQFYRNRSIMLARYTTLQAHKSVDWFRVLGCYEAQLHSYAVKLNEIESFERYQYSYLVSLSDKQLLAAIGLDGANSYDLTLRHLRKVMRKYLDRWEETKPRIYIFGAGEHTRALLGVVPEIADYLTGIIDTGRSGKMFMKWRCEHPERFDASQCDVIIYSSKLHEKSMYQKLAHLPVEHVLLYNNAEAAVAK